MLKKQLLRKHRHKRVRAKVKGTALRPRLVVYRSLKHIEAQVIDDTKGVTLLSGRDLKMKGNKVARAEQVGSAIAKACLDKKITKVVFDRNGYKYQGRVKALAEAARKEGLIF